MDRGGGGGAGAPGGGQWPQRSSSQRLPQQGAPSQLLPSTSSGQHQQQQQTRIQGQTLITVVNDPRADASKSWWGFGAFTAGLKDLQWNQPPPPLDPVKYPHYTRRDLGAYLKVVQALHQQFIHERSSLAETATRQLLLGDAGPEAEGDQEQQAAGAQASRATDVCSSAPQLVGCCALRAVPRANGIAHPWDDAPACQPHWGRNAEQLRVGCQLGDAQQHRAHSAPALRGEPGRGRSGARSAARAAAQVSRRTCRASPTHRPRTLAAGTRWRRSRATPPSHSTRQQLCAPAPSFPSLSLPAALREVVAQGDGLAKALQKVPVQFFQEDYSVER